MQVRYSRILFAFAILPLFAGSLAELFPEVYLPPLFRIALLAFGASVLFIKQYSKPAPKSVINPLGLIVVFSLLSLTWSVAVDISAQRAALNVITILFFYVYSRKIEPQNQLAVIFLSCFITLLVVGITTIPPYVQNYDLSYHQGNFRGYFSNSNSLAHYMSLAAFPLCVYLFFSTKKWKRVLVLVVLIVLGFFLIETRSRAAFAAALLSGLVIYFGFFRFFQIKKSAIVFSILLIFSLVYFSDFAIKKYENIDTFSTRSYLWGLHLEAILSKPILGWGIGINPVDYKIYVDQSYNYLSDTEKGSSYYVLPEEIGVPFSLVVFISFGPFFLRQVPASFNLIRRHRELRYALLPLGIVMGGLLHGVFESWFFSFGNPMTIIFWLSCIYISDFYKSHACKKSNAKLRRAIDSP